MWGLIVIAIIILSLKLNSKFKCYAFFIALLLGLFFFSVGTNAKTYSTDFIKIDEMSYSYVGEDFYLSDTSFSKYTSNIGGLTSYGVLMGNMVNTSGHSLSAFMTIDYYDASYQIIARSNKTESPGSVNDNYVMNIILYENDFLGSYTIDQIKYYKISYYTTKGNLLPADSNDNSTSSYDNQYGSYEYVIDKYNIDMVVNENNTFDITETITAYFNVPKHGIFRTIPLRNEIVRTDGTSSKNRVQITNLKVDNKYRTSRENGNYKIKIGSASSTLTGEQTYVIKYTYNIGKDPLNDADELYYNIIGNEWDTIIKNVTFNITMPKDFDSSKLGFSSGTAGSTNSSNVIYDVDDNKISGSYDGVLRAGSALTVRCELPEGYFSGAGHSLNFKDLLVSFLPILFLGIAILLWYKFGRDEKIVETVEFYPPAGFNSLEVGFLYKGKAAEEDVTSLLVYLANKGYIKITELNEKSLFSISKKFKITKLKEYDGNNINERLFLNGLFTKKKSYSALVESSVEDTNEVTSSDLNNNFYRTMHDILLNVNNKENKNTIFEKKASSKSIFIILMIIATYCLITIPPVLAYGDSEVLVFAIFFPGFGLSMMVSMLLGGTQTIYVNGNATRSAIFTKIFALIWGLPFSGIPWAVLVLPSLLQDQLYLIRYIIGICSVIGMIICVNYLPKRTPYGNEMLGKIKGFKNYLLTAEKDKLEALVMQNPAYFYDILPYAYVLDVSDKWIKNFESISLKSPDWYDSPHSFNITSFGTFMNSTMKSANTAMSSSPHSSSGGHSSGGGSSGGGSGGGGGGSW